MNEVPNRQMVAMLGEDVVVLAPAKKMTRAEALQHAAWIVALADMSENHGVFQDVLRAVEES